MIDRRTFVASAAAAVALPAGAQHVLLTRPIPATGERVPAVGLGTWLTFDHPISDVDAMARSRAVLERFRADGGTLIDSSPMYGHAEAVLGELLPRPWPALFAASKVWTPLASYGPTQLRRSLALWKLPRFELLQVHNLLNWRGHLKTLRAWKEEGRTRLVGITTSHGRGHDEAAAILKAEKLDVLQITWNPHDTSADAVMRLAADRGVAVIVNRPFDGGAVLERLARRPLPGLAAELGCTSRAALVLKWNLAHPAVTCAIPATTQAAHCAENLAALRGPQPLGRQVDALARLLAG